VQSSSLLTDEQKPLAHRLQRSPSPSAQSVWLSVGEHACVREGREVSLVCCHLGIVLAACVPRPVRVAVSVSGMCQCGLASNAAVYCLIQA
jgi:hypothetical protein